MPLEDEQLSKGKGGMLQFPSVLGAVVPAYNLAGVKEEVRFTPEALAGIYLGTVKNWNHQELTTANPGVKLPDKPIIVVHRSDGSGTTFVWTDYLSKISAEWKSQVGANTSVQWPAGLGAKGNEGVAGLIQQMDGAVGYVELIYALQNKLGVASIKNSAGQWVEPDLDGVTAAASAMSAQIPPDLRASIVNAPGAAAYPISGFTWLLAYKDISDRAKATALTRLMWWATHDGQKQNSELGYAPLPPEIVVRAEEMINSITTGGQTAFPGQ